LDSGVSISSVFFVNDLIILSPEIFIGLSVSFLLIFGVILGSDCHSVFVGSSQLHLQKLLGTCILNLCILITVIAGLLVLNCDFETQSIFCGYLQYDHLGQGSKGLLLLFTGGVLFISPLYLRREHMYSYEYSILVLLSVLGMLFLVGSRDLLAFYLAVELQSLCLYVLASFRRGSAFSTEAGLKYFVIGAFSSGLLLFGCSLVYGFSGCTQYDSLSGLLSNDYSLGLLSGILFLSSAIFFKLTAAPFHMWAPDVYEGSPSTSTLFFSSVPKLAVLVGLCRIYFEVFYECIVVWQSFLIFSAVCSMVIAAFSAFYQRKIKRFLAYSSIGHVGYMFVALACGTLQGVQGVLLYIIVYMVMTLNVWSVILGTSNKLVGGTVKYIDELGKLSRQNVFLGVTLLVTLFSIAGIPPLAGFCAKLYVFFAAMESSLYGLSVFSVLVSVVSAFYYLRWVKVVFFDNTLVKGYNLFFNVRLLSNVPFTINVVKAHSLVLGCTTLFLCFFFLYPTPFLLFTYKMSLDICCLFGTVF
jgi:NADH-quinone oxidoreductase subunit N